MRFGLFYEHQLPRPWREGAEERLLLEALEQIERADALGFDNLWVVEHHFLEEYSHSSAPEVFLAAASQRTRRIRLGHGIVQLPHAVNHPARVAERIATLDLLSGGRVELGTGEGSSQMELGAFGVPRERKREQWEEALDAIVRMFVESPFADYRGRWVDMPARNVVPKPKQKPHPPLWMACSRRETIELAARRGLGALSFSFSDPEAARPWVDAYYRTLASEACVPLGFAVNPNVAVVVPFMCHEDEATAIERGLDGAHFFGYALAHYYVFGNHRPGETSVWEEFERWRRERGFDRGVVEPRAMPLMMRVLEQGLGSLRGAVGTPEQIADLVARYEAAGVDQVILVAQAGRNRHEHVLESLELFAKRVMPRFALGREARERAKRERLEGAVARALARRPPPREGGAYLVEPYGEATPARPLPPVPGRRHPRRDVRERVETAVRAGMAGLVRRARESRLEQLGGARLTLRALGEAIARSIDPRRARGLEATIRFEVRRGEDVHVLGLRIHEGRAVALHDGAAALADVVVRIGAADFLRLVAGELSMGEALLDERLELEGDTALASRVASLFTVTRTGPAEPWGAATRR